MSSWTINITASIVAKSDGRALGLLIAKYKAFGGLPYDCYTKLYYSLVQPIIDYGSSVWGTKEYSCINAIQHRACRFYMGVVKHISKTAIQGDMDWILPSQRQWINVTRYWCRLMNMNNARVNKRIFLWALDKSGPK